MLYMIGPTADQYKTILGIHDRVIFNRNKKDLPSPVKSPKYKKKLMIFDDV